MRWMRWLFASFGESRQQHVNCPASSGAPDPNVLDGVLHIHAKPENDADTGKRRVAPPQAVAHRPKKLESTVQNLKNCCFSGGIVRLFFSLVCAALPGRSRPCEPTSTARSRWHSTASTPSGTPAKATPSTLPTPPATTSITFTDARCSM